MVTKKLQKFCQLSQAIRSLDSDFYNALDDLCVLPLLQSGKFGITMLYPMDKSVRKQIIDMTYSSSPEKAVAFIKAVILRKYYRSPSDIDKTATNKLNQFLKVEGNKWGPFKIVEMKECDFFDHRKNISIFGLDGKGEIPIKGEMAPLLSSSTKKSVKVGGDEQNFRKLLNEKLNTYYKSELKAKKSNVYVKKVAVQLGMFKKNYPEIYNEKKFMYYIGNDEISDSFLLDMIAPPEMFQELYTCFGGSDSNLGRLADDQFTNKEGTTMTYYELYLNKKKERIMDADFTTNEQVVQELEKNKQEQLNIIKNVVVPSDIRESIVNAYGSDKLRLSRDLFITLTSVMKHKWECEIDNNSYDFYIFMACNVHKNLDNIHLIMFEPCADLTFYGTLLKSDLYKYVPWMDLSVYSSVYQNTQFPRPLDLQLFSFNHVLNSFVASKTGGSDMLDQYLEN